MNNWNWLGGLLGNQNQRPPYYQTQEFQSEIVFLEEDCPQTTIQIDLFIQECVLIICIPIVVMYKEYWLLQQDLNA